MVKDLAHYCSDPFAIFVVVMFLLWAQTFISRGIRERSGGTPPKDEERQRWIEQIRAWHVADDEVDAESALPLVRSAWLRFHGPGLIGAGIGALIALALLVALSTAITGRLLLLPAMNYACALVVGVLLGTIGYVLGLTYGAYRLRRGLPPGPRYGDLQPRTVRSYRSPRLPLVLSGVVVFYAAQTVVLAPHISPTLHISSLGGEYLVPLSPLLIALPLILMVLTIGLAELLAARIVSLPRLVLGMEPQQAVRVDDLVRGKAVLTVEAAQVLIMAGLGAIQMFTLAWGPGRLGWIVWIIGYADIYLVAALYVAGCGGLNDYKQWAPITNWFYQPRRPA